MLTRRAHCAYLENKSNDAGCHGGGGRGAGVRGRALVVQVCRHDLPLAGGTRTGNRYDTLCNTIPKVNVGKGCLQVKIFLFFSSSCRPWINLPDVHYLQLEPKNINYVDAMVEEQASEYQDIITCTLLPS